MRLPDYRCHVKAYVDEWLSTPNDDVLTNVGMELYNFSYNPNFNTQTSSVYVAPTYTFFAPRNGSPYIPYLIHADLLPSFEYGKQAIAFALQLVKFNHEYPPLVLITYNGANKFLEDKIADKYIPHINGIINVNGTGFSLYNCLENTPPEFTEFFDINGFIKTRIPSPNPSAVISMHWDKPCISVATGFQLNEDKTINNPIRSYADALSCVNYTIRNCNTDFSKYKFVDTITTPADNAGKGTAIYETDTLPIVTNDTQCALCGKRRKGKYFYRVQGKLCSVCEAKIKKRGSVNILTFTAVKMELERERLRTRIANASKAQEDRVMCPICGEKADWITANYGFCPACDTRLFKSGSNNYFCLSKDGHNLYGYDCGTRRLTCIIPVSESTDLKRCDSCGDIVAYWYEYPLDDTNNIIVCCNCEELCGVAIKEVKEDSDENS